MKRERILLVAVLVLASLTENLTLCAWTLILTSGSHPVHQFSLQASKALAFFTETMPRY